VRHGGEEDYRRLRAAGTALEPPVALDEGLAAVRARP
jgi:hypothetical protein